MLSLVICSKTYGSSLWGSGMAFRERGWPRIAWEYCKINLHSLENNSPRLQCGERAVPVYVGMGYCCGPVARDVSFLLLRKCILLM